MQSLRMVEMGSEPGASFGLALLKVAELNGRRRRIARVPGSDRVRSHQADLYSGVASTLTGERTRFDGAEFAPTVTPTHLSLPVALDRPENRVSCAQRQTCRGDLGRGRRDRGNFYQPRLDYLPNPAPLMN